MNGCVVRMSCRQRRYAVTRLTRYMLTPDWLVWRIITPPPADLGSGVNQADSMFVDRYQEAFWVIWIGGLLKIFFKNCGY